MMTLGNDAAIGLWPLFIQSLDAFTIALVGGSVWAVGWIVWCAREVRGSKILPPSDRSAARTLLAGADPSAWQRFAKQPTSLVSRAIAAALAAPDRAGAREAAELRASAEVAAWYRRIEPLQLVGNLAPLVGLAGTVWGMIVAFSALGAAGGEAGPAELSAGISKALFHTLLGLLLAIPCLLAFGIFRAAVDLATTDAMTLAGELVERAPIGKDEAA